MKFKKPFEDKKCICYKIEAKINKKFPNADWNMDDACNMWSKESEKIKDNNIEFEDYADENYGCTCPRCGRMICSWCV